MQKIGYHKNTIIQDRSENKILAIIEQSRAFMGHSAREITESLDTENIIGAYTNNKHAKHTVLTPDEQRAYLKNYGKKCYRSNASELLTT